MTCGQDPNADQVSERCDAHNTTCTAVRQCRLDAGTHVYGSIRDPWAKSVRRNGGDVFMDVRAHSRTRFQTEYPDRLRNTGRDASVVGVYSNGTTVPKKYL